MKSDFKYHLQLWGYYAAKSGKARSQNVQPLLQPYGVKVVKLIFLEVKKHLKG